MQRLKISDDLSLPINGVTEKLAFLGRTGGGKTYAATKLCEEMLEAHAQVVALDPVGKWHGLRLGKDGKTKGYAIPVFGGLYGDVPLEPQGGALVADLIVDKKINAVVDVSQFILSEQTRFAFDFATRLYQRQKAAPSAIHLFIEECQEFIPQNLSGASGSGRDNFEGKMLHAFERIWKLGRNAGIGGSLITQRPQEVNKKVLNMTECMFVFQMTGPQEKKAVELWVGNKGIDQSLIETLPYMKQGDCHVWSPVWLRVSKVIHIAQKNTLDASATPEVGARVIAPRELSPIDVKEIEAAMAATIEKAKAEDPKELRKKIAELERSHKTNAPDPKAIERAVNRAVSEAEDRFESLQRENVRAINDLRGRLEQIGKLATLNGNAPALAEYKPVTPRVVVDRPAPPPMRSAPPSAAPDGMTRGEVKILSALIQHPNGLERTQLTVFTGQARSTRDKYLQYLSGKGFVEQRGAHVFATDAGIAALPDVEPLPTGTDLQEYWLRKLPTGEASILRVLIDAYPQTVDREVVSDKTGQARSTRDKYLQYLTAKELVVTGRGEVKASDDLFD